MRYAIVILFVFQIATARDLNIKGFNYGLTQYGTLVKEVSYKFILPENLIFALGSFENNYWDSSIVSPTNDIGLFQKHVSNPNSKYAKKLKNPYFNAQVCIKLLRRNIESRMVNNQLTLQAIMEGLEMYKWGGGGWRARGRKLSYYSHGVIKFWKQINEYRNMHCNYVGLYTEAK